MISLPRASSVQVLLVTCCFCIMCLCNRIRALATGLRNVISQFTALSRRCGLCCLFTVFNPKLHVVSICEPKQIQLPLAAIESAWPPHNAFWSEQDEPQEVLGSPSSSTLYPNSSSQIPIFDRIWRLAAMNVLNQQNVRAPCFVADKACPKRISSQSGRGAIVTTPQQPNLGKVRILQLILSLKTYFYSLSVANLLTCCVCEITLHAEDGLF